MIGFLKLKKDMKKIIIFLIILSVVSCKNTEKTPSPKANSTNSSMSVLHNTTWLFVDQGDNNGSYYVTKPNYINQSINKSTLSYKDSTLIFKMDGTNTSWTATYYLDSNSWLYYYYNPKTANSTFVPFGLQYNIQGNIMYQTNSSGEYQKYLKQ